MAEKVFVSSSQKDLLRFRSAVHEELLSMHLDLVMMEYFEANRQSGTLTSLRYVNESDIFVLVVGWRYGYPTPGYQISVTEMEYETALTTKMPILPFLAAEQTLEDPGQYGFDRNYINTVAAFVKPPDDPAQAPTQLAKLHAFRQRLLRDHVCKMYSTPDELRALIASDLHVTIQRGVKGQRFLAAARDRLWHRDYVAARNAAKASLDALPVGSTMPEAQFTQAQARYILALARLDGMPAMTVPFDLFKQIETLIEQSSQFQPQRSSYYYILGDLCQKFGQGAMRSYVQKGARLVAAGQSLPVDAIDQDNFALYQAAQP